MWRASPKRCGELIDVESVCEEGLVTKSFDEQGLAMQGLLLQDRLIVESFAEQGLVSGSLDEQGLAMRGPVWHGLSSASPCRASSCGASSP